MTKVGMNERSLAKTGRTELGVCNDLSRVEVL